MDKIILEFTLNGRKKTYYRRTDINGNPLTTTNKNSAKRIKSLKLKDIIKQLIIYYGKNNIKDIKQIKDETV